MGLDQYAWSVPDYLTGGKQVDFEIPTERKDEVFQFCTWRKHPNLHGWMEQLYRKKGGTEMFNCATVRVDAYDLGQLAAAVGSNQLPPTSGFFFGSSTEEDRESDQQFIKHAMREIEKGNAVYYDSWW